MRETEISDAGSPLRPERLDTHPRWRGRRARIVSVVGLLLVAAGISLAVALSPSSGTGFHGPLGSNPNGPGFTSGTGNTGTGSTGTGGTAGSTSTGSTGTGNTGTGNTGTGNTGTGNAGGGSTGTGNTGTGSAGAASGSGGANSTTSGG